MSNSPSKMLYRAEDEGLHEENVLMISICASVSGGLSYSAWFLEDLRNHCDSILASQSTVKRQIPAGFLDAIDQADMYVVEEQWRERQRH